MPTFASAPTIRTAIYDVLDEGNYEVWSADEDQANEARREFAAAVVKRIRELQEPPHNEPKLENLCDRHKRAVLPDPTRNYCVMCDRAVVS